MIYLDNAATTMRKPPQVVQAVVKALESIGNAGRGAYHASLDASRIIYDTRVKLVEFFGGDHAEQVAFTANSTESLNLAIKGLFYPGDHIITTALEHNSVLRPLYEMEEKGTELTILKSDEKGCISYEEMENAIRENTRAIICTHGSNVTGNLLDLTKIGKIAKMHGLLFIVDASQTAGVFPINVKQMQIDVLCFTGHKGLLGPQGTGGLYVKKGIEIRPLKSGGSGVQSYSKTHPRQMPTALEAGTLNAHGIAGLHAALDYLTETGIVYGDFSGKERCPIVTLNFEDVDSAELSDALFTEYGISTRPGVHCAPLMHEALGTVEQGAVRFSFSHYNTEKEILTAVEALKELAEL